jgi:hypothetical protein
MPLVRVATHVNAAGRKGPPGTTTKGMEGMGRPMVRVQQSGCWSSAQKLQRATDVTILHERPGGDVQVRSCKQRGGRLVCWR